MIAFKIPHYKTVWQMAADRECGWFDLTYTSEDQRGFCTWDEKLNHAFYYLLMISLWELIILQTNYFPTAIWPHGTSPYQSVFKLQTLQHQIVMAMSTVPLLKFLHTKYSVSGSRSTYRNCYLFRNNVRTQWVNNLLQIAWVDWQWQAGHTLTVLLSTQKNHF